MLINFSGVFLYFFEIANILLVPKIQLGAASTRPRTNADNNFADTEVDELVAMLRETENLEEQGDILQVMKKEKIHLQYEWNI